MGNELASFPDPDLSDVVGKTTTKHPPGPSPSRISPPHETGRGAGPAAAPALRRRWLQRGRAPGKKYPDTKIGINPGPVVTHDREDAGVASLELDTDVRDCVALSVVDRRGEQLPNQARVASGISGPGAFEAMFVLMAIAMVASMTTTLAVRAINLTRSHAVDPAAGQAPESAQS
jgi:hypothetical protein